MVKKRLYLWCINHQMAPVSIREKFAINSLKDFEGILQTISSFNEVEECVVISTCNRTEYYVCGSQPENISLGLEKYLSQQNSEFVKLFRQYFSLFSGDEVIEHLFKVVAGLDSLILGENQIVHQIKVQFLQALNAKTTGFVTNTMFQKALEFGKLVRTKTTIGSGITSIPQAAIELVSRIFNSISSMRILLVGAGETAELTLQCLIEKRCTKIDIINRTNKKATDLATKFHVSSRKWENIINFVTEYDLIIGSTSSSDILLFFDDLQKIASEFYKRPLVLLDLAVPSDFDSKINNLENVFLHTIDDLEKITDEHLEGRQKELSKAYTLLKQELDKMRITLNYQQVQSLINNLKGKWSFLSKNQIKKHVLNVTKDNPLITGKELQDVLEGTINKILQDLILFLHNSSEETWEIKEKVSLLEEIFFSKKKSR